MDLSNGAMSVAEAGLQHGDMVFLLYSEERQVNPVYKPTPFEKGAFGE